MIVVSDTSPLNYLVLIDLQHILPELFERILIPAAVRDELQSVGAPEAIARFMAAAPAWLETRQVSEVDPKLHHLDRGEREAITLAASLSAGSVLIDEKKGRLVARERGLAVSGTLGVLDLAARQGLVNLSEALRRLEGTTFRASPRLIGLIKARESK
jgi:predicted nucleic acid-binding protein